MTDSRDERPRAWWPLAVAGGVAVLVVVAAFVFYATAGGPSAVERAVIEVCEAAHEERSGPQISAGLVYSPSQVREYWAVAESHDAVPMPLDEVPGEVTEGWDAAAEAYEDSGDGVFVVVWEFADESYGQCTVPYVDGTATSSDVQLAPLGVSAVDTEGSASQ